MWGDNALNGIKHPGSLLISVPSFLLEASQEEGSFTHIVPPRQEYHTQLSVNPAAGLPRLCVV